MPKTANIISTTQHDVAYNSDKVAQKSNNNVLPPIHRDRFTKDGMEVRNMLMTQRINMEKIVIPALKLTDCSKMDSWRYANLANVQANQKALVRPWAAKSRKCSKENRPEITKIIMQDKKVALNNRKFSINSRIECQSTNVFQFASEPSKNIKYQDTFQITANKGCVTDRDDKFGSRDRMNSCRVATKKTGFPFNKKQYENFKLIEHFEKEEEKLSTIPSNVQQEQQKFISFDSFTELVF